MPRLTNKNISEERIYKNGRGGFFSKLAGMPVEGSHRSTNNSMCLSFGNLTTSTSVPPIRVSPP